MLLLSTPANYVEGALKMVPILPLASSHALPHWNSASCTWAGLFKPIPSTSIYENSKKHET